MASAVLLAFLFAAGVMVQLVVLAHRGGVLPTMALLLGLLVVVNGVALAMEGVAPGGIVAVAVVDAAILGIVFREAMLPEVGEHALVALVLVAWYLMAEATVVGGPAWALGAALLAVPTLWAAGHALVEHRPGFAVRVVSYVVFLSLLVGLVATRVRWGTVGAIAFGRGGSATWWGALVAGLVVGVVAVHGVHLVWLVRPPGRGEGLAEWKRAWVEHVEALGGAFRDEQMARWRVLALVAGAGVVLGGNLALGLVDPGLLVDLGLLAALEGRDLAGMLPRSGAGVQPA